MDINCLMSFCGYGHVSRSLHTHIILAAHAFMIAVAAFVCTVFIDNYSLHSIQLYIVICRANKLDTCQHGTSYKIRAPSHCCGSLCSLLNVLAESVKHLNDFLRAMYNSCRALELQLEKICINLRWEWTEKGIQLMYRINSSGFEHLILFHLEKQYWNAKSSNVVWTFLSTIPTNSCCQYDILGSSLV